MSLILPKFLTGEPLKATGIHLGIKGMVTKDMKQFVTETTPAGNPIINVDTILERLDIAGKFLANQRQREALLFATDKRFENALKSFHRATLCPVIIGRLIPGTLTNSQLKGYVDAGILIVSDPTNGIPKKVGQPFTGDRRAMQEAGTVGIPVVAVCNTNATFEDLDLVIPANNVGAKAIATVFYLLARSCLLHLGSLKPEEELTTFNKGKTLTIEDFETRIEEEEEEESL